MKKNPPIKNDYTHGKPSPYRTNPFKKDVLFTEEGQWAYPGQVTKIPSGDITMAGVPYPVLGVDNLGNQQMMQPGAHYTFPGQYVTEYPQIQTAQYGGGYIPVGYYPSYENQDGSYSNEVSMGLNIDDQEMLLPSFWDGQRHNDQETEARYRKTGEHLGKFNTVADSERAAKLREFMNNEVHPYQKYGGWLDKMQKGMKESVKNMKRLYNKDIPSASAAIPEGFVPDYGNEMVTTFETGGWLDELDEEYRSGGMVNPLMKSRSKRSGTSKNIQSSINKIFVRNPDIFGPGGKNIYNPKSKFQDGGDLDIENFNKSSEDELFNKYFQLRQNIIDENKRVAKVRSNLIPVAKSLDEADDKILLNKEGPAYKAFQKANLSKNPRELQQAISEYPKELRNVLPNQGKLNFGAWDYKTNNWDVNKHPARELYCTSYGCFAYQKAGAEDVPIIQGNEGFAGKAEKGEIPFKKIKSTEAEAGDLALAIGYASGSYTDPTVKNKVRPHHTMMLADKPNLDANNKVVDFNMYNVDDGKRLYYSKQYRNAAEKKDLDYGFYRYVGQTPKYEEELINTKNNIQSLPVESLPIQSLSSTLEEPELLLKQDGGSIVNYLASQGKDYSKAARQKLAEEIGIKNYDFSAKKNIKLLNRLKQEQVTPKVSTPPAKGINTYYNPQLKPMSSETTQRNKFTPLKKELTEEEKAISKLPAEQQKGISLYKSLQKNPKTPDLLQATEEQGLRSKAWDAVSHPFTAATNLYKYGRLPNNFTQGPGNKLDMAYEVLSPTTYINAGARTLDAATTAKTYTDLSKAIGSGLINLVGDQAPDDWNEAGMSTVGVAGDALLAVTGAGLLKKGLSKEVLNKGADKILESSLGKKLVNKLGEKKIRSIMPEAFTPVEQLTEEAATKVSKINNLTNQYENITKDAYINGKRQYGYTPKEAKELSRREAATLLGEYDFSGLSPEVIENITGKTLAEIEKDYAALKGLDNVSKTSKAVNYQPKADPLLNKETIKTNISEIEKLKSKQAFLEADPTGMYNKNLNIFEKLYRDKILKKSIKNKFGMPMATPEEFLLAEENQMIPIIESSSRTNPRADLFQASQRGQSVPKSIPYMSGTSLSDNSLPISLSMTKRGISTGKIDPVFMGYGPLNKMGHLSKYGDNPELTLNFINSEIAKFNKDLPNNMNIPNAFFKGKQIYYPRLALKNKKYGGYTSLFEYGGGWLDDLH